MCRGIDQGGRRCPCSSAQRQRAYRAARKARGLGATGKEPGLQARNNAATTPPLEQRLSEEQIKERLVLLQSGPSEHEEPSAEYQEQLKKLGYNSETEMLIAIGASVDNTVLEKYEIEKLRQKTETLESEFRAKKEAMAALYLDLSKTRGEEREPIKKELRRMMEEALPVEKELNQNLQQNWQTLNNLSDSLRQEVSKYVQLGGEHDFEGSKQAVDSLKEGLEFYPSSWVELSNKHTQVRPLRASVTPHRAHYRHFSSVKGRNLKRAQMNLEDEAGEEVIRHEYQELLYKNPQALERLGPLANVDFNDPEAKHKFLTQLSTINPRVGYEPVYDKDGSVNPKKSAFKVYSLEDTYSANRTDRETTPPNSDKRWEKHTMPNGDVVWRRPATITLYRGYKSVSEIRTNKANIMGKKVVHRDISIHELAHRFEYTVPGLKRNEEQFLQSRISPNEKLSQIYSHSRKEVGYKDSFISHYSGKVYDGGCREIMSTGMESVFGSSQGALIGLPTNEHTIRTIKDNKTGKFKTDLEFRAFVLGQIVAGDSLTKRAQSNR